VTKFACADARVRALPGALLLLVVLALLALASQPGGATQGKLPPPAKWSGVTVLYNSDVGGKIEPCG
jgi:hypothetical protein